jgi:hypothetical protein
VGQVLKNEKDLLLLLYSVGDLLECCYWGKEGLVKNIEQNYINIQLLASTYHQE